MSSRCGVLTVTLLSVGIVASCSNGAPTVARPPDAVAPGTAQVKLGDGTAISTDAVACTSVASSTFITTGGNAAGTTSTVTRAGTLAVASVDIRDVSGFTGSQRDGLQGDAKVRMAGSTYLITGTASGFTTDNPSATVTQPFSITVSC